MYVNDGFIITKVRHKLIISQINYKLTILC